MIENRYENQGEAEQGVIVAEAGLRRVFPKGFPPIRLFAMIHPEYRSFAEIKRALENERGAHGYADKKERSHFTQALNNQPRENGYVKEAVMMVVEAAREHGARGNIDFIANLAGDHEHSFPLDCYKYVEEVYASLPKQERMHILVKVDKTAQKQALEQAVEGA